MCVCVYVHSHIFVCACLSLCIFVVYSLVITTKMNVFSFLVAIAPFIHFFNEKLKKSRLMMFKQPEACLTSVKTQNYQLSVSAKHSSYQGSYNS